MSLAELVFAYATIAVVLVAVMIVVAIREKAGGRSIFARENWNFLFALRPGKMLTGGNVVDAAHRVVRHSLRGGDYRGVCLTLRNRLGVFGYDGDGGGADRLHA
jgi:hypothetical protein